MAALLRVLAFAVATIHFAAQPALAQETDSFTYDALGRLVTTSRTGGPNAGQTSNVAYDQAGNRTGYTVGAPVSTISIAPASANEGSPLAFAVTRSAAVSAAASVHWATSNGTAISEFNSLCQTTLIFDNFGES